MSAILRVAASALVLLAAAAGRADSYLESPYRLTTLLSVTWEPAVPVGGLRDFVDSTSFRGGQVEVRAGVARHLSLGLASSWNWFSRNYGQRTVTFPNATVTSGVYDRVQFLTLRGTMDWYLMDGLVQPYVGAGAGGVWTSTYQAVASFSTTSHDFALAADPHLGLLVNIGPGLAVQLSGRYQFTFTRVRDAKDVRFVGFGVGLAVY